jgi:BolA protein
MRPQSRPYKILTDDKIAVRKLMAKMHRDLDEGDCMAVEDIIRDKLTKAFAPASLIIENESAKHAGHTGARDHLGRVTGETHFRVVVVSAAFEGKSPVDRHRQINAVLRDELAGPVHALAIKALTPDEATR